MLSFRASDRCHWRGNPSPRPQARKPSPPSVRRPSARREASTLGVHRPAHRAAVSFRASDRCHWRGNPFPFSHADRGLFSFSSERKEEKKRRQKLRFWISLRGFTWSLSCQNKPRERCAVQISPKYCTVSVSLSAVAFALKCRRSLFYRG